MARFPDDINIFISYSEKDIAFLEQLKVHLSVFERLGMVNKIWYDGLIEAGADWAQSTQEAMSESRIILLLLSADFIASNKTYEQQMNQALALHQEGSAKLVPIILRPCLWDKTPLGSLEALPENALPLTSKEWNHKDEPYLHISQRIEQFILSLANQEAEVSNQQKGSLFSQSLEEAEHFRTGGKWYEALAKYQQALHYYEPAFPTKDAQIQRRINQCQSEIYFKLNLKRGKEAYEAQDYQRALLALDQALFFKPHEREVEKLRTATQRAHQQQSRQSRDQPLKFLQIKIFGIEVFKLVIAMGLIGVIITFGLPYFWAEEQLLAVNVPGGVIYQNDAGEEVFRTDYQEGRDFSNGLAAVLNEDRKWGYIDQEKNVALPFEYEKAWEHTSAEQLAYVKKDGKCGFIDINGVAKIPLQYLDAASFSEGLAMVKKQPGDFAFINKEGKEVIAALDSVLTPAFKEGEAVVVKDGQQMTINRKGNCVEACPEGEAKPRGNKRKVSRLQNEAEDWYLKKEYDRALMKLREAERINTDAEHSSTISTAIEKVAAARKNADLKKYRALLMQALPFFQDGDFKKAQPFYQQALRLDLKEEREAQEKLEASRLYLQKENNNGESIYAFEHPIGKWGIKKADGSLLMPPRFEQTRALVNGFMAVKEDSLWGYMDETGKLAIKPFYDSVQVFSPEGFAVVLKNGRKRTIDRHGRPVEKVKQN